MFILSVRKDMFKSFSVKFSSTIWVNLFMNSLSNLLIIRLLLPPPKSRGDKIVLSYSSTEGFPCVTNLANCSRPFCRLLIRLINNFTLKGLVM